MDYLVIILFFIIAYSAIRLFGLFIQWLGIFADDEQSARLEKIDKDLRSKGL